MTTGRKYARQILRNGEKQKKKCRNIKERKDKNRKHGGKVITKKRK